MLILIGVIIALLIIYGFSKKNVFSGLSALLIATFIGIAILGTCVGVPIFGVLIVLFFLIKGIISR